MRGSHAILLGLWVATYPAHAQPYRWTDENGRVHYTDTIPPASARDVQTTKLRDNSIGQQPSYELSRALKTAPVTLYTHPNCTDVCRSAREVLEQRGVPFTEVVADEPKTLEQLKQVSGGNSVPVLVVGGYAEKTPTASAYNEALDLAGYPTKGALPVSRGR
jgi:glutaredoxin